MPLPHAWITPAGHVREVRFGHWDREIIGVGRTFEDLYEEGWIRIGGAFSENFVQGRKEDIKLHRDAIGTLLEPGEKLRIAFYMGPTIFVTSEQFWDEDIDTMMWIFAERGFSARRPKHSVKPVHVRPYNRRYVRRRR